MRSLVVICGGIPVTVGLDGEGKFTVDRKVHHVKVLFAKDGIYSLEMDGKAYYVFYKEISESTGELFYRHRVIPTAFPRAEDIYSARVRKSGVVNSSLVTLRAPMPGLVTSLEAKPDDIVHPGSGLLILEAMKMENEIRSTVGGRVKRIDVHAGQTVEKDQPLVHIEVRAE